MEIRFENIYKSFMEGQRKRLLLENLSLTFPSGELSIILGKSGSGKSTILNLISGIDLPDRGAILIDGEELSQAKDRKRTLFRRRHIGFVFQFFNLIPTLTIMENVLLSLELEGRVDKNSRNRVRGLIDQVGLSDRLNAKPDELSGGEQQRTALVRALAHDPEIILADEPTGNLDTETGTAVLDLMIRLIRERGKTVIMATHSHDALKFTDSVFSIRDHQLERQLA